MALKKLPKLPEGLHPYYCIFYCESGYLSIVSADSPLYIEYHYSQYAFIGHATNQKWDKESNTWVEGEKDPWERYKAKGPKAKSDIIFTNFDIYDYEDKHEISVPKSPKATDIKVACGEFIEMNKGMIWDIGKSITLEPANTFQACNFKSSNEDICKVTEDGKIVAVGDGEFIITITSKL